MTEQIHWTRAELSVPCGFRLDAPRPSRSPRPPFGAKCLSAQIADVAIGALCSVSRAMLVQLRRGVPRSSPRRLGTEPVRTPEGAATVWVAGPVEHLLLSLATRDLALKAGWDLSAPSGAW